MHCSVEINVEIKVECSVEINVEISVECSVELARAWTTLYLTSTAYLLLTGS